MHHAHERLNQRHSNDYDYEDLEDILSLVQESGEFIGNSRNGRTIYKVNFEGKTLYPVLNKSEDYIVTFLAEHMINKNLNSKKYKQTGKFGRTQKWRK